MDKRSLGGRERVALAIVRSAGRLSRALALGSGSTIGGNIGLRIDPRLVASLTRDRRIAVVSGTNGKTTTTRFLAEALAVGLGSPRKRAAVAWSSAGANMPPGIVSALADASDAVAGVLEVDEAYVATVVEDAAAEVVVLLNLSRDQLDRVSEVRMLATRWARGLARFEGTVVANADDPLVVFATRALGKVRYVSAGGRWHADAYHCPACDASIRFPDDSTDSTDSTSIDKGWRCVSCDFARPVPDAVLDAAGLALDGGAPASFELAVPGRFNRGNAAMAAIAAHAMGVALPVALGAISQVSDVAGRFSLAHIGGVPARLLLAKNPAGWSELLELVRGDAAPVVAAINSRAADGHDPSWLWDADFESLSGRDVVATGERHLDVAVRLLHGGVAHLDTADLSRAVRSAAALRPVAGIPFEPIDVIGNYTAFQDFRRLATAAATGPDGPDLGTPSRRDVVTAEATASIEAPVTAPRRNGRDSPLRVVVVHPDLLGTYGDGGNGRVLANRALWRGYDVELVLAPSDRPLPRSGDLYCLGGGEDGPQLRSAALLRDGALAAAVEHGAVLLAVCAGFQIIGESFCGPHDGVQDGVGLLPARTVRGRGPRSVGEVVSEPAGPVGGRTLRALSGFENHAGVTLLADGVAPLGLVRVGVGNGSDGKEGALAGRVIGTYLHGPVLARNPDLADALLSLATGELQGALDDRREAALRAARIAAATRGAAGSGRSRLFAQHFVSRLATRPSSA